MNVSNDAQGTPVVTCNTVFFQAGSGGIKFESGLSSTASLPGEQREVSLIDTSCNLPKKSQHAQYALHFPIPFENVSSHENSQRLILLYGVGKSRSQAMATTKEVTKALCAMLSDLGKVDDSVIAAEHGQMHIDLGVKRERDEQRAALYKYVALMTLHLAKS